MTTIRVQATGPASPETAWRRYDLLDHWARWAPQIRSVTATSEYLVRGATGVVHGPVGLRVPFRIDDVDRSSFSWQWTVHLARVRITMVHDLTPGADGTIAGLTVWGPGLVVRTYAPIARHALNRLVAT